MLKNGDRAPQFTLNLLEGGTLSLAQMLERGRLLLGFLKTSCPTCQYTFPFLERLKERNVVLVSQDDTSRTTEFREAFGISLPTGLDSAREHYPVSNAYGLTHVPTCYLIGTDGFIARAFNGFSRVDLEEVAAALGTTLFGSDEKIPGFRPG